MSPLIRWILAVIGSFVLSGIIIAFAIFGIMAMAFGSAGCSAIGGDASVFFLIASPIVMSIGVLAGAVLFGLNKRWQWWVGALGGGSLLGILGYLVWFILVSTVWCN